MAAKKKRKVAAPRGRPKKRAGRPVKKKKARTKSKVWPAQPPAMDWGNSFEPAAQIATRRQATLNAAARSTVGAVEPPVPLTPSPLVTSSPVLGSPALHAKMIEQIEALEPEIASLRKHERRRGIGHTPEPIELAPLSAKEFGEIRKAMAVLKKQPPAPAAPSAKTKAAVTLLMNFGDRLRPLARVTGVYLAKQTDNFVTEAVKEAAKRIVQSPLWLPIIYKLPELADIAHQWLKSLGPHL